MNKHYDQIKGTYKCFIGFEEDLRQSEPRQIN